MLLWQWCYCITQIRHSKPWSILCRPPLFSKTKKNQLWRAPQFTSLPGTAALRPFPHFLHNLGLGRLLKSLALALVLHATRRARPGTARCPRGRKLALWRRHLVCG